MIDSKWNNAGAIVGDPKLQKLNHVKIEYLPNESKFWRWQTKGEGCLSTIEALYYILKEYEETVHLSSASVTAAKSESLIRKKMDLVEWKEELKEETKKAKEEESTIYDNHNDNKNDKDDEALNRVSLLGIQDGNERLAISSTSNLQCNTISDDSNRSNLCFTEDEIPYNKTTDLIELLYLFRLHYFMIKDAYQINPSYQGLMLPMDARKKAMEVHRLVPEGNLKSTKGRSLIQPRIDR